MLNETISAGLNNPDCAFFVGSFTGSFLSFKYLIIVILLYFGFKLLDAFIVEPSIAKFKKYLHKKTGDKNE